MKEKLRNDSIDRFFKAILTLENIEECYVFFEDACTANELTSMSQRFAVMERLCQGKTYLEIVEETGSSTATISRVNRTLKAGVDGYKLALARIKD